MTPHHPKKKSSGTSALDNSFTKLSIRRLANSLGLTDEWLAQFVIRSPDGSLFIAPRAKWFVLIKAIVEQFCPRFVPGGALMCVADAESRFVHLENEKLAMLGVYLDNANKIPDLIVHSATKNWLLLFEALVSVEPVDGKRRKELTDLFKGCKAELVFITAFHSREAMRTFLPQISWETVVWVADEPDHLIHFNGDRFLGPYSGAISM
jgi:adenine-specific DNA-methyltransferase